MYTQPINISQPKHNTTSFTGYVDKSVIKLLDRCVDKIGKEELQIANKYKTRVNLKPINKAIEKRNKIITMLQDFMEPLHEDSKMVFKHNVLISIINEKVKSKHGFSMMAADRFDIVTTDYIAIGDPLYTLHKTSPTNILDSMEKFGELLGKVDTNDLNKKTYQSYTDYITKKAKNTSIFGKLWIMMNAKKANKIAKEFGEPPIWKEKLNVIRNQAIADKNLNKKIIEENNKILKNLNNNNKNSH